MANSPMRGMLFGAIGVVLGLINLAIRSEEPSSWIVILTYVLIGLGIFGFVGSLILYLKQKSASQ